MKDYKEILAEQISEIIDVPVDEIYKLIEVPADKKMGDFAFPCFTLAKTLRKSPNLISQNISEKLREQLPEIISHTENKGPYLNFFLNKKVFIQEVYSSIINREYRKALQLGNDRTVVIDFSSPNVAKPFSIGHLRSTSIGNSLYRIFEFCGYKVIGVNHLGDWGTQFGKLMVAYEKWGDEIDDAENKIQKSYEIYVRFHDEAENNPELEKTAREWFRKLEAMDERAVEMWEYFRKITIDELKRIYELLNVKFDYYTGESFYNDNLDAVVEELQIKGLLKESEGALIVDLDKWDMSPALVKKTDGTTLYITRDIAAALYRKNTYDFDKALYVVAHQQSNHFSQLRKVLDLMGYKWYDDIVHVQFGLVRIGGKMASTRKGHVVFLEDVINEVKRLAYEKIKESDFYKDLSVKEQEQRALEIGISSVVFFDLKNNRIKDIEFDWDEVLNIKGETGIYLQYNHARLYGIINKYIEQFGEIDTEQVVITEEAGFEVARLLYDFIEKVKISLKSYEPSIIARYLLDLAKEFSVFYTKFKVINEDNETISSERILTIVAVKEILSTGLSLLGIKPLERM